MKHLNKIKNIFLLITVFFLTGCAQYKFNNQSFSDPEDALEAQQVYLENIEKKLNSSNYRHNGNLLIVTPSKRTAEALGIKRKGTGSRKILDYLSIFIVNDFSYFEKFLVKSQIFDSVEHVIDDYPLQYVNKFKNQFSATIYMHLKSPTEKGWYIEKQPSYIPEQIKIDRKLITPSDKIQAWLKNIENKLKTN